MMNSSTAWLLVLSGVLSFPACGGNTAGTLPPGLTNPGSKDSGSATVDDASEASDDSGPTATSPANCNDVAMALCNREQACSGSLFPWSSLGECESQVGCTSLNTAGTRFTSSFFEQCANAISAASCAVLLAGDFAECEVPPGPLAVGAACQYGDQCASYQCGDPSNPATCGRCVACTAGSCDRGYTCTGGVCVAETLPGEGAACDSSGYCASGLSCNGATCVPPTLLETVGAPCNTPGAVGVCDPANGLECTGATSTGASMCQRASVAKAGAACAMDGTTVCENGASCIGSVCLAPLNMGAPCGGAEQALCGNNLQCENADSGGGAITLPDGGGAGTCQPLVASSCN